MPRAASALMLMQAAPGKPYVTLGADRASGRRNAAAATAFSSAVVLTG
jgi:hypothetical protein